MAVTLRFQSTGTVPGDARPVTMQGGNLTIGRSTENDMVLPDPDGLISRRHCVIEDHGGALMAVDISTNGTYLNYAKTPIGRAGAALNDGDVLILGNYELVLSVTADAPAPPAADPLDAAFGTASGPRSAPDPLSEIDRDIDFLDDLLGSDTPAGPGPLRREEYEDGLLPPLGEDADPLAPMPETEQGGASAFDHSPASQSSFSPGHASAPVIPDDWDDDFLSPAPKADPAPPTRSAPLPPEDDFLDPPSAAKTPETAPPPEPSLEAPVDPEPAPQSPTVPPQAAPSAPQTAPVAPPPTASGDLALRAFLEGAGASQVTLPPEEVGPTMARIGTAFRAMVEGMREVLMTRASIKGEFRIDQTMIGAGQNNPLKFSVSGDQAMEAMIKPSVRGYLEADAAAEQALKDIKAHEVAMLSGMEAALKGLLARLDPGALTGKIEAGGGVGGLLKGKKARYWEVYEKMYAEISSEAEEDFQEVFSKEFARAYKAQLDKLK